MSRLTPDVGLPERIVNGQVLRLAELQDGCVTFRQRPALGVQPLKFARAVALLHAYGFQVPDAAELVHQLIEPIGMDAELKDKPPLTYQAAALLIKHERLMHRDS